MKIVTYIRTATKNKDQLREQRELLNAYCKEHHHVIMAEFVDFGEDGNTMNRPALKALQASVLQGAPWDGVLAADPSRLTRRVDLLHPWCEMMKDLGVEVLYAQEGVGAASKVSFDKVAQLNEYYANKLIQVFFDHMNLELKYPNQQ